MTEVPRIDLKERLSSLYSSRSKHASYQSVPKFVAEELDYQEVIDQMWRGDQVRMDYIERHLQATASETWGDFGANTGYFTLSLAHAYPETSFVAIEANETHANFIQEVASAFRMENVTVLHEALGLDDLDRLPRLDVLLHLNVLHHAGSDFDLGKVSLASEFPAYATEYLGTLARRVRTLIFQVGANLWGDKSMPWLDYRNHAESVARIAELLGRAGWAIEDCSLAGWKEDGVVYKSVPWEDAHAPDGRAWLDATTGLQLDRHPGEFFHRPLFICRRSGSTDKA